MAALRRGDLAGARTLRLPGGLANFPREILDLADTLELLDLGPGTLDALPDDFGRLKRLKVLFCSNNRFARLPPAISDCASLEQVGCRGGILREVPGEALPPRLRWLTLTDNALAALPPEIGRRPRLQKLMLSGNRLASLPPSLAGAPNLELLRVAANRFDVLPAWLANLPRLGWMAWAGNPFEPALPRGSAAAVPWGAVEPGVPLGEGASGRVLAGLWRDGGAARPVALKLFKGAVTSDGLPGRETAACLAAGPHPHLVGALGRLTGHPEGVDGLVMPLLPAGWRPLAGPPSLDSCSRDVYAAGLRFAPDALRRIARGVAAAAAHLHAEGLMHGDLYAHNVLWDGAGGEAALGDFGAASALPGGGDGARWRRVEVRAFGLLLGELLDRCDEGPAGWRALEADCTGPDPRARPDMAEVAARLA